MKRRALVSAQWIPEFDRNRGAQRVDAMIRFLVEDGWSVQYLSERHEGDDWHVRRLRQLGVATFVGYEGAESVVRAGKFDLAVLAFWQPAERLIPIIRELSPKTRIVLDTIDLHFLRDARRSFGVGGRLDSRYGEMVVRELNTYQQTDVLLTTSAKEGEWLNDIVGAGRAKWLAMEEPVTDPPPSLEGRRGILFVGYFRHLPNTEAVEYLCGDILPLLDPDLLARHPLTVIGSGLDDKVRAYARDLENVEMVGWVPSVLPYFAKARVCAFPLLHGAGVKGKVLQSFMMGTPVVTTRIGIEGLGVSSGEQVMVAETAEESATCITRLLTRADEWQRLSDAGRRYVLSSHDEVRVKHDFLAIVSEVVSRPAVDHSNSPLRPSQRRHEAYRRTIAAVTHTVTELTEPGEVVLIVSKGDDELLGFSGRIARHFPQGNNEEWAGFHPESSEDAIRLLEEQRNHGARYLVIPDTSFWWMHHYDEFAGHLDVHYRRLHSDDTVIVYDMLTSAGGWEIPAETPMESRALVIGTYGTHQSDPAPELVEALGAARKFRVTQRWRSVDETETDDGGSGERAVGGSDWVVHVDNSAVVPTGFLDDFLTLATRLGADRAQPAHLAGPSVLPVGERLNGCIARQLPCALPIPLLAMRADVPAGPVMLLDVTPIEMSKSYVPQIASECDPGAAVTHVYVPGSDGFTQAVHRSASVEAPAVSVLISTFQRPALLESCLEGFCSQTLDDTAFEVVVVDDGSSGGQTAEVLKKYEERLPLTWVRIDHSGRSAAKNLAVLLARAELVLFFDDDDRPDEDLLHQHVLAHSRYPGERTAVLGHTDWAPELEQTLLMHFLTEVDKLLFSYGNLKTDVSYDWKCFWEGRISCKRAMLLREGLHDQRINYSIDVEMAWRLRKGLEVRYWPDARSHMARGLDLNDFCARMEGKGRAQARISSMHPEDEILQYTKIGSAREDWESARDGISSMIDRARVLEKEVSRLGGVGAEGRGLLDELHRCYRAVFGAHYAKGVCGELDSMTSRLPARPHTSEARENGDPGGTPELSVVVPVWSRTPELADMAQETIARVWSASQVAAEVIVIDNGSPHMVPFEARVHRFEENRGVATAWNVGAALARAPVLAFLNSDCTVERGWDLALMQAATTGRRIAFPYTDHGDGEGFRQPDQGGTAGWCFVLTRQLFNEIGQFDERFNPAYGEDTDYWHRAWEMGIELSPVPIARVRHTRRATAKLDPHVDWLLQGHRYKYGWKHGVDPLRAPPYYNRPIVEYHYRGQPQSFSG